MTTILFWKPGSGTKHSLTLRKSQPGWFIRELKAGGWRVQVLDGSGKRNEVLSDAA